MFSYFKKGSFVHRVAKSRLFTLFSPEMALGELMKHSDDICVKAGITKAEFIILLEELRLYVVFMPSEEYVSFFGNARLLAEGLTKEDFDDFLDDIDFVSLSLRIEAAIWSNDGLFKKIRDLKSYSTSELVELLKSF